MASGDAIPLTKDNRTIAGDLRLAASATLTLVDKEKMFDTSSQSSPSAAPGSSTSSSSSDGRGSSKNTGAGKHTSWFSFGAARERANEIKHKVQSQFSEASVSPEEDAASHVDTAKRVATEQLQARKRVLALRQQGSQDTHHESIRDRVGSMINPNTSSSSESATTESESTGVQSILSRSPGCEQEEQQEEEEEESALSTAFLVSYFIAGGAAGAASRTVVSPLERLKIIMQVQPKPPAGAAGSKAGRGAYSGVVSGLVKMWQEEGFKGYMRGNGINCLRIAPYSAVQFSTYEVLKAYLKGDDEDDLDVPRRLFAGALAGIASVVSTYPLDLVRSRISIASASMYAEAKTTTSKALEGSEGEAKRKPTREELRKIIEERQKRVPGIWAMTANVYREEGGIRALYKGCVPTSLGVAPYVGINFAAYEALRKRLADEEGEISTLRKLSCGALAGSISQTLTYPLDVLRRRMQVSGMKDSRLGYSDKSAWGAVRTIVMSEGIFGLYRGIVPNLLKVAPSIGTSFATYEVRLV